jgi:hypothetical protein
MVIDIAKKIIISFVFVLSSYGYNESMRFDPSLGRYNDCSGVRFNHFQHIGA